LQARIAERLPGKPFTTDQLRMLGHDCVRAQSMPGLADLGIVATPIDLVVPEYLVRFRPGGAKKILEPA
jgi:NADH dehydrogenase